MTAPAIGHRPPPAGAWVRHALTAVAHLVAAATGAWFSYGFGLRIGGPAMGLLLAVNAAVMAAMLVDAAADAVSAYLRPRRRL